jgi:FkbM family methyltransferase
MEINNFTSFDSIYGRFVVNRHCAFQAESLAKTGRTHIEAELSKIFVIIDRLAANAVVVDGGANIGFFTIPVAQRLKGRGGRLISFEPQRMLYYALCGSVALNDLDNVHPMNVALGQVSGTATLPTVDYSQPNDFGTVSVTRTASAARTPRALRTHEVDIITIDSMELTRLDFLKLDVEGCETQAVAGAMRTLQQHRPWIWIEYFIIGKEAVKTALRELPDYDFYIMDYQNMLCAPREKLATSGINIQGGHT